ncbi:hypothetical protein KOR42_27080 [Thalassoglobus neptunius]|uniref:Glycosyltransferase n=1 Tax=Thalassoglobus neptunius TaxID=1938619 RepID=A0A5C5WZR4_9PLAN|nr:glycosyltransferase [Thalassoglobus neptunius]TWT55581.1 hypothetical protein KOR42_27080 [Thalassoglobus neptunius]
MSETTRNVICMNWGTLYGASYVNRLYRMVQRHLTLPHNFYCFTNNELDLDPGIKKLPLPADDLTEGTTTGAWNKVYNFRPKLDGITGQVLFLDLDILIIDNIDCFFDYGEGFCVIKEWTDPNQLIGNTSVYRFEAGGHAEVYEYFMANRQQIQSEFRREQAYVTGKLREIGSVTFWPQEWCVSYKHDCIAPWPWNWFQAPKIPSEAKIIAFHGRPKPEEAINGTWVKLRRVKAQPALKEHWI